MKRKRYVHGYKGFVQCVYGKDSGRNWKYVEPCGIREAKKIAKHANEPERYCIYELVEVKPTQAGE